MGRLEDLRGKMARNPGQMSDGERMELRFLEKQEESNMKSYFAEYQAEKEKRKALEHTQNQLQERIKMQDGVIQTLLAALQGKIKD